MALLASSRGYAGVCVLNSSVGSKDMALMLRRVMLSSGLLLFIEQDIRSHECAEYADVTVLTYDKIHMNPIPSFKDGEERAISEYAERCNPEGSLIDLSPFALLGENYVDKSEAYGYLDRIGSKLDYLENEKIITAEVGKGKRKRLFVSESLENTVAKLRLVGEYGYLGISFDVMRIPQAELLIFAAMFSEPPEVRTNVCNPK